MEMMLNKIVPEGLEYRHSCEGPDDMVSPKYLKIFFFTVSRVISRFQRFEIYRLFVHF